MTNWVLRPVYYLGFDESTASAIHSNYKSIDWVDSYRLKPDFQFVNKNEAFQYLQPNGVGLIYIEMGQQLDLESQFLQAIRDFNPNLQIILVVEKEFDYFQVARDCQIGNVIRKNAFDASIIRALTIRLMTANIFGFEPYFPNGFSVGPYYQTYQGEVQLDKLILACFDFFIPRIPTNESSIFKTFLHELITNTVAYSIGGISAEKRDTELTSAPEKIFIPEKKTIKVSMVADHEKTAFSVQDSTGTLSTVRVLDKLRRQSCIGEEKLPPGIWDASGRGISLIQKDSRFVLNILRGVRTETIFMHYNEESLNRFESIIITEVSPFKTMI